VHKLGFPQPTAIETQIIRAQALGQAGVINQRLVKVSDLGVKLALTLMPIQRHKPGLVLASSDYVSIGTVLRSPRFGTRISTGKRRTKGSNTDERESR